jgi:hypothetical protein
MRSHRLALTALSIVAVLFAAGCGSGRDKSAFLPDTPAATPNVQGATAIPQVVVAGPKQEILDERDAAKASAAASLDSALAADDKRKATAKKLHDEREKAQGAHKRAVRREHALEKQLAEAEAARKAAAKANADRDVAAGPTPKPAADAPITASDTGADLVAERNKRSDLEARAAVLRFHELLDHRDARSCDLLTDKLMTDFYGAEDPEGRCRAAVEAIDAEVSVVIAESTTYAKTSTLAVVTHIGDQEIPQTMHLVLVDGTWELDAVERRDAS